MSNRVLLYMFTGGFLSTLVVAVWALQKFSGPSPSAPGDRLLEQPWSVLAPCLFIVFCTALGGLKGWAADAEARRRRERKRYVCVDCNYDLRGTIIAGRDTCPECGRSIKHAAAVRKILQKKL